MCHDLKKNYWVKIDYDFFFDPASKNDTKELQHDL